MIEPQENEELLTQVRRPAARGVRPRVLIVDDDEEFLELASLALAGRGFDVSLAHNADEAVRQALRATPDLILLDILLGGDDGIDVLESLRDNEETRAVPVVACTSLGQRDSGALLTSCGFDGLVAKPLDLRVLAQALVAHLRARSE